jgi:hypothetical protein
MLASPAPTGGRTSTRAEFVRLSLISSTLMRRSGASVAHARTSSWFPERIRNRRDPGGAACANIITP